MRHKALVLLIMTGCLCWAGAMALPAKGAEDDVPRMSQGELKQRLGNPDLVVVDVRTEAAWKDSTSKIKGAVRENPKDVQDWLKKFPKDKTIVFYCS